MADKCGYGTPVVESRTVTPEYAAGHERAFGKGSDEPRKAKRTRYRWNPELKRMVEIGGPDDPGAPDEGADARTRVLTDLYMDGVRTFDSNEDIGSRKKRREYMRRNGLSDMSDWKGYWAKKEKERAAIMRGEDPTGERRQMIGRLVYEQSKKRSK